MQGQKQVSDRNYTYHMSSLNIVLNNLRSQLSSRGANSIRGFSRVFATLDSYNGNRTVDAQEFFVGLKENGLNITKQEADVFIVNHFILNIGPYCIF